MKGGPMDNWDPGQYEKFKDQRAKPFWDLLSLLKPVRSAKVVDLGCGTGELTKSLHEKLEAKSTLGIDSSAKMLSQTRAFAGVGLAFEKRAIEDVTAGDFDVVFSNAALQWLDERRYHPDGLRRHSSCRIEVSS